MISRSFNAFLKTVQSEFTLEELVGIVTKERIDQVITGIRNGEFISEEFCVSGSDGEEETTGWYGLKIDWNNEDRSGILTAQYKEGITWYKFNLGSLHLNRLYDLVPDMDQSEEEELKAVAEEEILDNLMKWDR